ncbi:MAG: prepilin-type N-terminal cleavage/methylation domain-containing protein [Thermoguttaceae bacterium]|nr:prepilin-type N-terminal cleavage/methylation domain-containing protein [Thermoguttaceae bacterium]MDW8079671.1 prepilin-type N-terminal cleavage/methylation domain-containing protein [Thermoguttaceae bacterium]
MSERPCGNRRAYTLTEMVIVLAVVAALMALAWPSLSRPSSRSQLRYAAKYLRAELAQARLEAIRTNKPWQFCYAPGTGQYMIGPVEKANSGDSFSELGNNLGSLENAASAQSLGQPRAPGKRELPGDVIFEFPEPIVSASRTGRQAEVTSGTFDAPAGDFSAETVSPPEDGVANSPESPAVDAGAQSWERIVFLPSGRCMRNYLLMLRGPHGFQLPIVVRAVTGTALVGEVMAPSRPPADGSSMGQTRQLATVAGP